MLTDGEDQRAPRDQSQLLRETLVVFAILAAVLILIMVPSVRFYEPDELCYYFASRAMRSGQWWLSPAELESFRHEATVLSPLWPHDLGYVRVGDRFVLVKAPGFPLYLAFLRFFSMERLANIILIVASTLLLLFLGQRIGRPWTAALAVTLLTLSPICLIMQYRTFMSDYAAAAVLFLGGGGLILLGQPENETRMFRRTVLTLLVGLLFGFSVVLRLTNAGAVFFMGCIHVWFLFSTGTAPRWRRAGEIIALLTGGCLALCLLFAYNHAVFGRMLATGYQLQDIRPQDTTFIVQQLARGYWYSGYETIIRNLAVLPEILLRGLPWWPIIPVAMLSCRRTMDRRTWWLLCGWVLGICLVFFQYRMLMPHNFVIISRMYLPLTGPAALLVACWAADLSGRASLLIGTFTAVAGLLFFLFFLGSIDTGTGDLPLSSVFGELRDVISVFEPLTGER